MKICITGSSGLIGSALKEALLADGHEVTGLPRNYEDSAVTDGCDVVIHLAGENVATGRWTPEKKQHIEGSRVLGTHRLAELIAKMEQPPALFLCASAIGIYGNRGDEELDESSSLGDTFLAEVGKKWEHSAELATEAGIRTVNLRLGVVLSKAGGALAKMLTPFKLGLGGKIGTGQQYLSWIDIDDIVGAVRFIVENQSISGPVNLTAPNPVTNAEFTKTLAKTLKRPALVPLPSFAVRLLLGEMGEELLLHSTRVLPKKLMDAGYHFCHSDLESALTDMQL